MDRLKELNEAKAAANDTLEKIDRAISSLDSASNWGLLDILGGGLISSFAKRDKINTANEYIKDISYSLRVLNKELKDVNTNLPYEVSDTMADNVLDIWFDNIFTDLMVQSEIKDALNRLNELRMVIIKLLQNIDAEINNYKY